MATLNESRPLWLGYCTNVHAGADVAATRRNLARHALDVKQRFSPNWPLGVGLWLSAQAAKQLRRDGQTAELATWLKESGIVPFTLNGFPYGDFHQPVVKHKVYLPTWQEDERRQYTFDLIEILDELLPLGQEGSISTLPVQWGTPSPDQAQLTAAAANLVQVADRLRRLEQDRGRLIYVCLEPEPGCVLQRTEDVIRFFEDHLLQAGEEDCIRRYLRVCHDVCHAAVMFEDQQAVLARYRRHGILVGKAQVSSAIVVPFDRIEPDQRAAAVEQLQTFREDRYLHQTMIQPAPGVSPIFFEDLPQALQRIADPAELTGSWRIHFHVPVYLEQSGLLETSRSDILGCVEAARQSPELRHWEVETYAWSVLPQELQTESLADGISQELAWFRAIINTA